jgi:hypothetical protein
LGADTVRIGCGSGFWGDAFDPAMELLEGGALDALSFDFLAELTMALLQRARARDPQAGYIEDAVDFMTKMAATAGQRRTRLVSNGGGVNPRAAAQELCRRLRDTGHAGTKIGIVTGDDLLHRLDELAADGVSFANTATGDTDFGRIRRRIVSANAYLGADGIVEALAEDAEIVLTGRVADSSVFVGPILHALGRGFDDPDLLAAAITAGHIAECAAGCTGGMSSRFDTMPEMGRVGFPIVEFKADGSFAVTKLAGTGGRVDSFTVKEHLVYEIGDPRRYVVPDGVADFTSPRLRQDGDRVIVSGVRGQARPEQLKVLIGYADGWIGEGLLFFPWPRALARAEKAKATLLERFERLGLQAQDIEWSYVGINALHGPAAPLPPWRDELNEVGLRVAVRTATRDEAEKVRRACAQLWIMGPGGTAFGVPIKPRPVISLWPSLIARERVPWSTEIMTA